jgi:6-phosphogluconolactonase
VAAIREQVLAGANAAAERAAAIVAEAAREAVAARGRFVFAVSGGRTPATMLRALAAEDVPWEGVRVVQVDERVAPEGHADRNLGLLRSSLLEHAPVQADQVYPMPVEEADLDAAASDYARLLTGLAGAPPEIDLVHLGLGADGHTASLVPGDAALAVKDADVAVTGPYQGRRRMTLTFPALDRARRVLWLVTGAEKAEVLEKLRRGDASIPAARVRRERALLLADAAAAGEA